MKNLSYSIRLAAVAAVAAVVLYMAADHSADVLDWLLELLDNPNF